MWIFYAIGSSFFAGITAILAKCGIKKTDSDAATAIRTVVVPIDKLSMLVTIAFSWIVFHEKLTKKAAAGILLITAGTVLLAII